MRRLELRWLRTRLAELQKERRVLYAQILRTRSLYAQLNQLLGNLGLSIHSRITYFYVAVKKNYRNFH